MALTTALLTGILSFMLYSKTIDPYYIQLDCFASPSEATSNEVMRQAITITGMPRTGKCEHYLVKTDDKTFAFESFSDLQAYLYVKHEDFRRAKIYSCRITNNFGMHDKTFDILPMSLRDENFQRSIEAFAAVTRLNAVS